jgi:hypothetical protein
LLNGHLDSPWSKFQISNYHLSWRKLGFFTINTFMWALNHFAEKLLTLECISMILCYTAWIINGNMWCLFHCDECSAFPNKISIVRIHSGHFENSTVMRYQSSRKPTGPKTEASEFEVGPVKIENQEVRLTFGFYQTFYNIYFRGSVKIIGGQSIQTIHWSYWPASLNSFREDCVILQTIYSCKYYVFIFCKYCSLVSIVH